jgi:muramoyltetrapeptide carboxypeptidase
MLVPPRLKKGDTIGLVSPSRELLPEWKPLYENAKKEVETKLGLKVKEGEHVWEKCFYNAGTEEQRAQDFNEMVADKDVKAIIFTIGGKGAIRLLEYIDWELLRNNPKIISGISDPTILLTAFNKKLDLVTYYGVEFIKLWGKGITDYELNNIKATWFDGKPNKTLIHNQNWEVLAETDRKDRPQTWRNLKPGVAEGRLCGGSFGTLTRLNGTEYQYDFNDKILFLESFSFKHDKWHDELYALKLRGIFDKINGLIIGYNYNSLEVDDSRNRDIKDIINNVTSGYSFPILYIPDIGHYVRNLIMPIGVKARVDANNLKLYFLENTVS